VKTLQRLLTAIGYPCGAADGIFGNNTLAGVKAFQKANNLSVDGVVGKNTWTALLK
jgi:peptidoglycan hydrolase-like protein with peptidoglycan-binding domain